MRRILNYFKNNKKKSIVLAILLLVYYFSLPKVLFDKPTSTVIESQDGALLGAMIAEDGQWRFPESDSIPEKFKKCIVQFEDEYFYKHPGFNPISIFKALKDNIAKGKIVRGGSTLTQQVIRLSRNGQERSYIEKVKELILATRLEFGYSKEAILKMYASHAPFGGNVVGLDVAAWRYFGLQAHQLSWAETATLAILPNAPSLIYPGKNQEKLLRKRNRLLKKLADNDVIDQTTYELALLEELPQQPYPLPQLAPHLLQNAAKNNKGKRVKTTIDYYSQEKINAIVKRYHQQYRQNQVHNMAVLVLDIEQRNAMAYVGNTATKKEHQKDVDIIQAPRSTGSVLKPLLYMAMLNQGELLPNALVADIPTTIADYQPENFDLNYTGAISAKKALARSLNIPAVRLLNTYGLERFYQEIQILNLKHINKGAEHYGLSLILGGAESSLWDICSAYAGLAATVNHFSESSSEYYTNEFISPSYIKGQQPSLGTLKTEKKLFDAGSIYLAFEAMKELNRPEGDEAWKYYDSTKQVAWKTGTSFGNKDAWAIGVTPKHIVGIWVGNADGEGRPGLTGVSHAGPVLFDVLNILPQSSWFEQPLDELEETAVCAKSGFLANTHCPIQKEWIPRKGKDYKSCTYHQLIHVDQNENYRINASCATIDEIKSTSWFHLPPLMEWYYKKQHADYKTLPPFRNDCKRKEIKTMDFIFPKQGSKIILAKGFDGKVNKVIFKIAHTQPETKVFWYLNNEFISATTNFHEIALVPKTGQHMLTVVDEKGNEAKRVFSVED